MTKDDFWALEADAKLRAWEAMSPAQRDAVRDLSSLHPRLIHLEGQRVAVTNRSFDADLKRFWVGRTTGWKPLHMAVHNSRSMGSSDLIDPKEDLGEIEIVRTSRRR